jgi:hypothetical protein
MKKIARNLDQLFATVFSRRIVNKMARTTGFVKRKSEIGGMEFLTALSLGRFKK